MPNLNLAGQRQNQRRIREQSRLKNTIHRLIRVENTLYPGRARRNAKQNRAARRVRHSHQNRG
jgi:hypothetical protein